MINHLVNQRYEILEKIGDSPLFSVYKARDKVMNRVVALKTVSPPYASDSGFVEALQAGLMASGNLNHPNITHFQEFGAEDGTPYATVEFVRGINLKERIRRIAPFTLSVVVDFACAIGEALHYAHSAQQTHGDLRPQNVIVSPEGVVKVSDFGVQRAIARSSRAQQEILLRAAAYHAPELSMKQPGTVGGDIYAVGAMLYEMLTGTPLYTAETPEAMADQHAYAAIPSPRVINPGVPRSVEGIVVKCLQKQPGQRYTAVADLLNDLKSVRDALRFGKPLSWSPIDVATAMAAPLRPAASAKSPEPKATSTVAAALASVEGAASVTADVRPAASAIDKTPPPPVETSPTRENLPDMHSAGSAPSSASVRLKEPAADATSARRTTRRAMEPVADVAASSSPITMSARSKNRLRAEDERVSIYLKVAAAFLTSVILVCVIVMVGIYSAIWVLPQPVAVPQMVGKSIDEVREMAKNMKIHLKEHAEYTDQARNRVYRTDPSRGDQIRPGKDLNVWYSKGPTYVNVPNLAGTPREDAEQKLKDAGLTVGKIVPEYSDKVAANAVIRQDVSPKKRVLHDTAVDLVISDGPKPDYAPPDNDNGNDNTGDNGGTDNATPPDNGTGAGDNGTAPPVANTPAPEEKTFDRTISIPHDGRGARQVKIEVEDADKVPNIVIDEQHNEGDKIPVQFNYTGKNITLRIYYDDKQVWQRTFDPQATRNQRIQ